MVRIISNNRFCVFLFLTLVINTLSSNAQTNSIFLTSSIDTTSLSVAQLDKYHKISRSEYYYDPILIEVQDLLSNQDSGRVFISLPNFQCDYLPFLGKTVEYVDSDNYYWYGEIVNENDSACNEGSLMLISKNGERFGLLRIDSLSYDFHDLGDGIQVLAMNDTLEGECGNSIEEGLMTSMGSAVSMEAECGNECPVRIFIFYTQSALNFVTNIDHFIEKCLRQTNQALINSWVDQKLKLVVSGSALTPFVSSNSAGWDLEQFQLRTDVQNTRIRTESDLVVLITQANYYGTEGKAFKDPTPDFAIALVQANKATSNMVFAHEVGHLFGCRHENEDLHIPFSHAHRFLDHWLVYNFRPYKTIVGDKGSIATRILHYSNPRVRFKLRRTGVADERDNVKKINSQACAVSNFSPNQPAPLSGFLSGFTSACACKYADYWMTPSCGTAPYSFQWETSYDGINFNPVGQNSQNIRLFLPCFQTIYTLFLRGTITDATGMNYTMNRSVMVVPTWSSRTCGDELFGQESTTLSEKSISAPRIVKMEKFKETGEKFKVNIYPQPASDFISVDFYSESSANGHIEIVGLTGIVFNRKNIKVVIGENRLKVELSKLQAGAYILRILKPDGIESKLIVIAN